MVFPLLYSRSSLVMYFTHSTNMYKTDIYQRSCVSPNLPIHPNPPLVSTCSLHLCLYFCFVNKIVYTNIYFPILHICINIPSLFFSFWLTSLCSNIMWTDPASFVPWALFYPQRTSQQLRWVNSSKSQCQQLLTSVMCRQFQENKYLWESWDLSVLL